MKYLLVMAAGLLMFAGCTGKAAMPETASKPASAAEAGMVVIPADSPMLKQIRATGRRDTGAANR